MHLFIGTMPKGQRRMLKFLGYSGKWPNRVLYVEMFAVLALGLNVVVGFTGLLDLGT